MAPITLYSHDVSPPCCLVRLVADVIGVDIKLVLLEDVDNGMRTPELLKKFPQHTIPSLEDNGLNLSESRAISMYLVSKYSKDDSLYPKDVDKRAAVDQRLFYDQDFYNKILTVCNPLFYGTPFIQRDVDNVNEGLEILNRMLEGKQFLAGDKISLADYSVAISLETLKFYPEAGIEPKKHANIAKWFSRVEASNPNYLKQIKKFQDAIKLFVADLKGNKEKK